MYRRRKQAVAVGRGPILKHANQMLGDRGRRQEELTFKCDVVFADCKNGFEEDAKPKSTAIQCSSNPARVW